jgi:hypothetical protein
VNRKADIVMSGEEDRGGESPQRSVIRRYPENYSGICVLIAESTDGPIKSTIVTREIIRLYGQSFIKAVQMTRSKLKIFMRNPEASNELAKKMLENVKISIPQRLVECVGVCHINPDITDDDLCYLKAFEKSKLVQFANPKVVSASRINKKPNQWTVTVTFTGKQLPSHVELDRCLFPVREYYYPVRQCFGCWRYGHSIKQCKSARRCAKCGKTHEDENAYQQCEQPARCVHCQGSHQSNDKKCEVHVKKVSENKIKQTEEKEKDPAGEWPCFSQGKVDKQVPPERNSGTNEVERAGEPTQTRKRKNMREEEPDKELSTIQLNLDEILQLAATIAIGLRPKEDMVQLIASQISDSQEGGGGDPALRL